jgi:hypothetical protein
MSHLHVGPACQPLLSPPFPPSLCVFPVMTSWGSRAPHPPWPPLYPWASQMSATPLRIILHRPSLCPVTLGRRPIKRVAPVSLYRAAAWGFSPQIHRHFTKNQRGRSGRRRRKWGRPGPPPRRQALGSRRGEAHPAGAPIRAPPRIWSRCSAVRGEEEKGERACTAAPLDRGDRRCLKPEVAAFKEAPTRPWSPRTTPLSGLQARPPEEGVPCVAAAKPEQLEPGTPTPKPEPSVVKSPPRNRSRTCWRRRRVALLPLQQAGPQSSSSAPPRRLAVVSRNAR